MKTNSSLKQNVSISRSNSLYRGNSRLNTNTRIKAYSSSSGRIVDGNKIWSMDEADHRMSRYIIARDRKCLVTGGTEFLTCSHYQGRGNMATRFDPKNLICLDLWTHERFEADKQGGYKNLMIALIGQEECDFLEAKAKTVMKKEDAIIECMRFLEKEEKNVELSAVIKF